MGGGYQAEVANGKRNLWTNRWPSSSRSPSTAPPRPARACRGGAGRGDQLTSGQGLVLMKEVLYTISGKRLPVVFHIGARALPRTR